MKTKPRSQAAAVRFGPAIKATLLVVLFGGSAVGYVWQKNQIHAMGRQLKTMEVRRDRLHAENRLMNQQLLMLRSPVYLERRVKELNLGLSMPVQSQMLRLVETPPETPPASSMSRAPNPPGTPACNKPLFTAAGAVIERGTRPAPAVGNPNPNPLMGQNRQHRRLLLLGSLVLLAFTGLGWRLVDLQAVRSEELGTLASEQSRRYYYKQARRGDIRDVRGNILAVSQPVKTVCIDPVLLAARHISMVRTNPLTAHLRTNSLSGVLPTNQIVALLLASPEMNAQLTAHQTAVAQILSPALGLGVPELLQKLQLVRRSPQGQPLTDTNGLPVLSRYVVLKKNVAPADWELLDQTLSNRYVLQLTNALLAKRIARKSRITKLPYRETLIYRDMWWTSVFAEDDQLRIYPNHTLAAHVLGYTGQVPVQVNNQPRSTLAGQDGVETVFNSKLSGTGGWRLTAADAWRKEILARRDQDVDSIPGLNVFLALDARVQQIVEEEMDEPYRKHSPRSVSVVVTRPATGDILAMACLPAYDPNQAHSASQESRRNRVITEVAEPGSTFKIVTVAAAINEGVAQLSDVFFCENGAFHFAGFTLHDHERYGNLTVEEIIMKSSNVGTAKIAIDRLGAERVHRYITDFGFGARTGLPLNGESPGILPALPAWSKLSVSRIPIGQGVAATALQTVMAMGAIANGGLLMRPRLVDHLEDDKAGVVSRYPSQIQRRVITEAAARQMNAVLKTVVTKDGTAVKARLEHYTVAGKTGTAQKLDEVVVQTPRGPVTRREYSHTKYYASFIGYFPTDKPELCIGVFIDEPVRATGYYGGIVAAPVFKRIAERVGAYLGVRPDITADSAPGASAALSPRTAVLRAGPAFEPLDP